MAVNILLKRSATASKRPVGASMAFGELNLNYDSSTGGLFYKDSNGDVVKVGPCQVSATAPNSSPAGSSGNSAGEFWYDSSTNTLKVYDGTSWVEAGGSVDSVTGTAPVTVDNTDPLNPVISVDAASTTAPGVVQLVDSTASTSTTEALTANQGYVLQEQINALAVTSNLTLAGTLSAATGEMVTVTTEGAAQGFEVGELLPSPAAGNAEFFVIATVGAASYTPPGGSPTEVHVGDWFLSDGTVWNFLDVGFQAGYASTTSPGVVMLATDAEVQAGVNTDHAVVPSSLQSKLSDSTNTTSSTTIASSTAVKSAYDAAITAQGQASGALAAAGAAQGTADQAVLDAAAAQGDATQALSDAFAAQSTASQAVLDAAAAQATADAAMPIAGGTFTGTVEFDDDLIANGIATFNSEVNFDGDSELFVNGVTNFYSTVEASGSVLFNSLSNVSLFGTNEFGAGSTTTVDGSFTFNTSPTFPVGVDIGAAAQVTYDNATSGLAATNVQAAIDELAGEVDGVQGITGTAPITVGNTDPANPVIGIDAASTSAAGAVQLYDGVDSISDTEAATANAVKIAYDAALAAQASSPMAAATVLFVNGTTGDDLTGERGTAKPYETITGALADALNGDTIYVAPGTYAENVTLNKGVILLGTYIDQALSSGPKISGTFTVNISGAGTRNWAVANFNITASSVGTNSVVVSNNSFGSGGIGTFTNCFFGMFTGASLTERAFQATGTWTRSLYLRNCTFDGNAEFAAGAVDGSGAYTVVDNWLGIANGDKTMVIASGTTEFRNPSQAMAPVLQTGGAFIASNILAWQSNTAANSSVFGGTGFAYKGTSVGLGAAYMYLIGQGNTVVDGATWGKISVGSNVIYAFNNVVYDTSLATLSGTPLYAVAPNVNGVTTTMSRPQWSYLKTASSVAAANQLGVILDSTNGNVYTVSSYDAGTY